MNESIPITVAGIDVGKAKLDVHLLEGGVDRVFRNDKGGRRAVRNWLLRHGVTRAVFEPTGRYHRNGTCQEGCVCSVASTGRTGS